MRFLLALMVTVSIFKYNGDAITLSNVSSSPLNLSMLNGVKSRIHKIFGKKVDEPGEPDPILVNEALSLIALNDIMERPKRIAWLKSTMAFLKKMDVDPAFKEEETRRCVDDISKLNEEDKVNKCNLAKKFGYDFARLPELFNELDDLNKLEDVYGKLNRYPQIDENVTKPLYRIIETAQTKEMSMKDLSELLRDVKSRQDLKKIFRHIPRATLRIRMLHGLDNFALEDLDYLPPEFDSMDGFSIISGIVQGADSKFKAAVTTDLKKMSHSCKFNQRVH